MKNKKKTDLRSGAKAAAEKPISNIDKNDKAVIRARMHEIKKYKDDISSTQNTIGYTQMFKDGICQIDDHRFSKTIQFFDTNYQLAEFEEQNGIFSKYCDLINYLDNFSSPLKIITEVRTDWSSKFRFLHRRTISTRFVQNTPKC